MSFIVALSRAHTQEAMCRHSHMAGGVRYAGDNMSSAPRQKKGGNCSRLPVSHAEQVMTFRPFSFQFLFVESHQNVPLLRGQVPPLPARPDRGHRGSLLALRRQQRRADFAARVQVKRQQQFISLISAHKKDLCIYVLSDPVP